MDETLATRLHLGGAAAAVVLLLLGAAVLTGPANATPRLGILAALAALLGLQAWLVLRPGAAPQGPWTPPEDPVALPAQAASAQPAQPAQRMVIRCKHCGEVFPVEDTGARPLVAACPHCGRSGNIKVRAHGHA